MLDATAELLFGEALMPSERASSVERLMQGRAPSTVLRELLFGRGVASILEQPKSIVYAIAAVTGALEAVVLGRPAGKSQEQVLRTANEDGKASAAIARQCVFRAITEALGNELSAVRGSALERLESDMQCQIDFPNFPEIAAETFAVDIVDIGSEALYFEGDVYERLTRAGNCRILAFDPFSGPNNEAGEQGGNSSAARAKGHSQNAVKQTLPYFVADGREATFHVNYFGPTSSLFPSNVELLSQFSSLAEICATQRTIPVQTCRLDEVEEVSACDFLKIDTQGSEFEILSGASRVLDQALVVHLEAEFSELYSGQKLFADSDSLLRGAGFEFIDFLKPGRVTYRTLDMPHMASRLLWSDCVYMKRPERIAERDPLLLLRTAYIFHVNYRKYDLAAQLVRLYDERADTSLHSAYVAHVLRRAKKAGALKG